MGKHVSTEVPPALPYFGKAPGSKEAGTQPVYACSCHHHNLLLYLRGSKLDFGLHAWINCMGKWYSLLEKGVITQNKYEQLQETIGDMSTL